MEIQIAEDLSSILSFVIIALVALVAWRAYARRRKLWKLKTRKLEGYLRSARNGEGAAGRSILQIIENVGVTEDEAIQISFESPNIGRRTGAGEMGNAGKLLFIWTEGK